jgi:hypothetical protein
VEVLEEITTPTDSLITKISMEDFIVKDDYSNKTNSLKSSSASMRASVDSVASSILADDKDVKIATKSKTSVHFVTYSSASSADEKDMSRPSSHSEDLSNISTNNGVKRAWRMSSRHSIAYSTASESELTTASRASSLTSLTSFNDQDIKVMQRVSDPSISQTSASDLDVGLASRVSSNQSIAYSSASDLDVKKADRASDHSIAYSTTPEEGISRATSRASNYSAYSSSFDEDEIRMARRVSQGLSDGSSSTLTDEDNIRTATRMSYHSETSSKIFKRTSSINMQKSFAIEINYQSDEFNKFG